MTVSQTTVLANSDHEKANRQTTFTHISNRQHDADAATLLPLYLGTVKSTCGYWNQKTAGLLEWTNTPSSETKNSIR